ncbi:hypothetical protein [Acidiphilium cryptum]|uniref:hypothetical protein n=1 Tax=Acidiphilium cryptum TaxID=524 RepID=UPI0012DEB22B|nr:hypothetical protein [Acidiphilium cryptum]
MPKVVKNSLTAADVQAIAEKLDQLEEKPRPLSTREIINMLKPKVAALRAKGYSFDEIAAELTKNGIKISGLSLKSYTGAKKPVRKPVDKKSTAPDQSEDKSPEPPAGDNMTPKKNIS